MTYCVLIGYNQNKTMASGQDWNKLKKLFLEVEMTYF